jgi:hypothetical protein
VAAAAADIGGADAGSDMGENGRRRKASK